MKVFAALGASVCLLAIPAGSALAASSHASGLPSLPTLNGSSSHGGTAAQASSTAHASPAAHHDDWRGHDWDWLKHKIDNRCRHHGHGWGHGGFGAASDDGWGGDGDHDGDDHRCRPHPTSP
ncbi:hypothetical protein ACO2Q3_13875 [Caulobacter sp. KR2-114]|uniref:hypothetical protein n=1 Tax=Caulobacter sp. KR2-114 TaxID=3400912 RepID=UPI003C06FC45